MQRGLQADQVAFLNRKIWRGHLRRFRDAAKGNVHMPGVFVVEQLNGIFGLGGWSVEELRRELLLLRDAAGLELDLPVFDLARPGSLQHEMDRRVRDYQDMLATATEDLSGLEDLAYTKRWIKETRQMFAQTEPGW